MMDQPALGGAVNNGAGSSGGAVPNTAEGERLSESKNLDSGNVSVINGQDSNKIRDLQNINKKLEEELQHMRDAFA